MKAGVTISSVAHVAILAWGIVSIAPSAPEVIELGSVTMDFEATEISTPAEGDKQAEIDETPAPKETKEEAAAHAAARARRRSPAAAPHARRSSAHQPSSGRSRERG